MAQYIRAHPSSAFSVPARGEPFPKATIVGEAWPTGEESPKDEQVEWATTGLEADGCGCGVSPREVCRLCPDFSALYGHNVYICKRLATA